MEMKEESPHTMIQRILLGLWLTQTFLDTFVKIMEKIMEKKSIISADQFPDAFRCPVPVQVRTTGNENLS